MSETTPSPTTPSKTSPATISPDQVVSANNSPPATAVSTGTQASLGQRAGAYMIDIGVMIGIIVVGSLTIGMMVPKLGSLISLVGAAYLLTRDCLPFLNGQSIGKKLLGLRAVTTDGQSLSGNWNPGLIRNAVLFIPVFPLVELIILITKQNAPEGLLRLGDQWAGTKVIIDTTK